MMLEPSNRESDAADQALTDTLIVEFGSRIGSGVCGSLLAQLGVTVVLVEGADRHAASGKALHRCQFAAGKWSIVADPVRDREIIRNLIECSDAVIGSSDIDGDAMLAGALEHSIVCDITAYGRTGLLAGKPDSELQIQAVSGIVETTGTSDGLPVPIPLPIVEFMTGVYAAAATIVALMMRRATGVNQLIDMALYDCAFAAMATFLPRVLIGDEEPIRRIGNRHPMIAPWNVYRANDGWILICVGNDSQWQRLCDLMRRPELAADARFIRTANRLANTIALDEIVQGWVGLMTTADCLACLSAIQIACGPVARIDRHPREANLEYRGMIQRLVDPLAGGEVFVPASPLRMSVSPGLGPGRIPAPDGDRGRIQELILQRRSRGPRVRMQAPTRSALDGLRIVEIGHYTTVPLSTRLLASLGADVVKVEPPEGEATRDWPPTQSGQGYFFTYMNSDKRSLMLDLRRDADVGILRELLKTADILVENLKPGTLARRGLSFESLSALNPRLIYCGVSGFGADSIYTGRPAYDTVIQAMSGMMDVVRSGDLPLKTGISSADLMGAEMAIVALLAALSYRERTGKGQSIDLSMQDIAAWMTQTAWNDQQALSPSCLIQCSDGVVLAETSDKDLPSPHAMVGTNPARLSRTGVVNDLASRGIGAAPVLSVHEMMAAPHTSSRDLWRIVTNNLGSWPLMSSPLRLTGTPPKVRFPMPELGRDNDAIFRSLDAPQTVIARSS
jgi:crotonobetainyl-CoA:carnitine CoA-transferase CaiB-like acyl-CoA transferase